MSKVNCYELQRLEEGASVWIGHFDLSDKARINGDYPPARVLVEHGSLRHTGDTIESKKFNNLNRRTKMNMDFFLTERDAIDGYQASLDRALLRLNEVSRKVEKGKDLINKRQGEVSKD